MSYQFPPDIEELVRERMATGHYGSEDEVLRDALRALSEEAEDLAAVKQAIDDWRAGDEGVPVDKAFDALRKKHGLS
ncbi:MAG: ribbon-helix-helix domain-containing protein [Planctomycetota bacterium]